MSNGPGLGTEEGACCAAPKPVLRLVRPGLGTTRSSRGPFYPNPDPAYGGAGLGAALARVPLGSAVLVRVVRLTRSSLHP